MGRAENRPAVGALLIAFCRDYNVSVKGKTPFSSFFFVPLLTSFPSHYYISVAPRPSAGV